MNYYQILEIQETATQEEIRTAYRNCAKKYHPDLNKGKTSDKMVLVNQAYTTLNDPMKRSVYNRREGLGEYRNQRASGYQNRGTYQGTYAGADNPFGFDSDMSRMWEEMVRNMGGNPKKEYSHNFTRRKLSVAIIKRLLKQDVENKKEYESYANVDCDLCSSQIVVGEKFWFIGEKQKMCKACKKDILSHL